MGKWIAAALVLTTTAVRAERPSALETVPLVLAEATLALDMLQTLDVKRHPGQGLSEDNPILGRHPGDARVIAYFAGVGLLTGTAWYTLPRGWRVIVPATIFVVQLVVIGHNASNGAVIRF